jgi:hypothetical protein
MIAGAFADKKVVISFPQRDVHLDLARPVQVEMVPAATGESPALVSFPGRVSGPSEKPADLAP